MSKFNQFIPLSNQLGIPGSSYRLQLGKVNDKWAVRLAKGSDILDSQVFEDSDPDNPPNANSIVGWVLQVLPIPNLNPYQIVKSVGFIRQEAIRNNERAKKKPVVSMKEAKEAKLTEIPDEAKRKLESKKQMGWVKEKEEPEESTQTAPTASASVSTSSEGGSQAKASLEKKRRKLASIPMGGGTATPSPSASKGGIKCLSCGTEIKFCPYCGKPLDQH